MTDPADGNGRGDIGPEERAHFKRRLSELDKRLERTSAEAGAPATPQQGMTADSGRRLGYGMQMALDLVVGPVVGAGIGYGLDRLLGTRPILLIVVGLMGAAAGVLNLVRTYKRMQAGTGTDLGRDLPEGSDGDDD